MKQIIITLIAILSFYSCEEKSTKYNRYQFPDVLDIKNIPANSNDWEAFCFSDLGAWYGFALPDDPEYFGKFIGPFSMRQGHWLSRDLLGFGLFDDTGKRIELADCISCKIHYYPGLLEQNYLFDDFSVKMNLFFISTQSTIVSAKINNLSNKPKKMTVSWEGSVFDSVATLVKSKNSVILDLQDDTYSGMISTSQKSEIEVNNGKTYIITELKQYDIGAGKEVTSTITFTYKPKEQIRAPKIEKLTSLYKKLLSRNNKRWSGYINKILSVESKWFEEKQYRDLSVKALETLILNWRAADDDLKHDGLFPSSSIWYFNGFWAWDSWKHAVALTKFAPVLAKDQIRTMFDYQNEKGMVADCIYLDKTENNWRDTKPPLAAWAVWKIYESTNDRDFIEEMYPKLLKYHQWWYQYRDHDQDGLCEYGSTDGTLIAAKWESGMDNAVRFDNSKILDNNGNEWSIDQESVDLNSYLVAEKQFLGKMAEVIGEDSKVFYSDANKLKSKIQKLMFDEETEFFYDINIETEEHLNTKGPEGWTPLFTGVAKKNQAEKVVLSMSDTSEFATYIPFPTVSKSSPMFSTGYWRGTVWLDQACFGVMALREYGFNEEADKYTKQIFDRAEGLIDSGLPIRENYWSIDGKGMRANNFSWSAAHILMLLWEEKFD